MPAILRRPRASADLSEIWEFIAQENLERADAFVDRIDEKFRSLAMPPYVIFYEAQPDGVIIARVLHGARDVKAEFNED